jgi:hypothetical protein
MTIGVAGTPNAGPGLNRGAEAVADVHMALLAP